MKDIMKALSWLSLWVMSYGIMHDWNHIALVCVLLVVYALAMTTGAMIASD
nr:MAG TPA: hypothetical protein [Caudoviricetes sp.]